MTTSVFKYALVASAVIVAAGFGVWYLLSPPDGEQLAMGKIEGTTNYPSEYIPEQIVCAEPVGGGTERCVKAPAGDDEQLTPTWSITVPAGAYYISSHLRNPAELGGDVGDYRAYYTTYVTCGMTYECKEHTKLPLTVGSGETVSGITPYDWYMR